MSEEKSIFVDKNFLSPRYRPKKLLYRENEMKVIGQLIDESLEGEITNILITGPPGTGKTEAIKLIFKKIEEKQNVLATYVNCFQRNTRMGVLYSLVLDFYKKKRPTRRMPSRRGIAYDELLDCFCQEIRKSNTKIVLCLDEVDQLLPDGDKLLYDLSRLKLDNVPVQIIAISNNPLAFKTLDKRARSSLYPIEKISFDPYTEDQMNEIIKNRAEPAFQEKAVTKDAIEYLAEYTAQEKGDVRIARETLLRAGEIANKNGSDKVTVIHIQDALDHSRYAKSLKILREISEQEKFLLQLIPESGIYYPEFYKHYRSVSGKIGDRMLRNYMEKLQNLNLINMERKGVGGSYLVNLSVPKDVLFETS